jgi:hypothetical protein
VDFGTGEEAQPTYPQLLGSVVPVGYSKERGQTLYARIGTNVSMTGEAQVVDDFGDAVLMATGDPFIYSNGQRTLHKFNLGTYNAANPGAIVSLSYDAESLADAKTKAAAFKVNSQQDMKGTDYALTMYSGSNAENCNANVTYDETTKRATFAFSVSDSANYGKDWYITTGTTAASALLYGVKAIPEVTEVSGTAASAGSGMTATWDGSSLAGLSKMSFYLTPVNNDPTVAGYSIGEIKYRLRQQNCKSHRPGQRPGGGLLPALRLFQGRADKRRGIQHRHNPYNQRQHAGSRRDTDGESRGRPEDRRHRPAERRRQHHRLRGHGL